MHPQVVEEVKAGKPLYFFLPTPRTKHRKLQMVEKVEKNLSKFSLKKRITGQSRKQKRL